jgi:hypothetical protein
MSYRLIDKATGRQINIGDAVHAFLGRAYILRDFRPGKHRPSDAQITVEDIDQTQFQFSAATINAEIRIDEAEIVPFRKRAK